MEILSRRFALAGSRQPAHRRRSLTRGAPGEHRGVPHSSRQVIAAHTRGQTYGSPKPYVPLSVTGWEPFKAK